MNRIRREWSIYLIEAENGKWYAGITKDPERRIEEHRSTPRGAKFFRTSPPKSILFRMGGFTRSEALQIEHRIKKLNRIEKAELIENPSRKVLRSWLKKSVETQRKHRHDPT
jgi:putative endonuclease